MDMASTDPNNRVCVELIEDEMWVGSGGGGVDDGFTGVEGGQLAMLDRLRGSLGWKMIKVRVGEWAAVVDEGKEEVFLRSKMGF